MFFEGGEVSSKLLEEALKRALKDNKGFKVFKEIRVFKDSAKCIRVSSKLLAPLALRMAALAAFFGDVIRLALSLISLIPLKSLIPLIDFRALFALNCLLSALQRSF